MKLIYKGNLKEVEFLMTGKRFKQGEPVEVTDEEYQYLKNHPDFVVEQVQTTGQQPEKPKKEASK